MNSFNQLDEQLSFWGINLNKIYKDQFMKYYELLIERNRVMNLTAITGWEDVCTKHFLDSAALCSNELQLDFTNKTLIDIGSGAGFPGIVLKILQPNLNVLLLDALTKRVSFLNDVLVNLQLFQIQGQANLLDNTVPGRDSVNVSRETSQTELNINTMMKNPFCVAVHGRAEELALGLNETQNILKKKQNQQPTDQNLSKDKSGLLYSPEAVKGSGREQFDFVTARAVSDLRVLCEYALPLLKIGGFFCAYKTADIDYEVKSAKQGIALLGGEVSKIHRYSLPTTNILRSLVFIQKVKLTEPKYPRHNSIIKKKPL